jgi:hypothetical protein
MTVMLLALDLGTKTGWATTDGKNEQSGTHDFSDTRFSGGGMRYLKFEKFLGEFPKPSQVVFEEVRKHNATDAAHVYGGFLSTLTSWCEKNNIPYQGVPVGTIKRHFTGNGNAGKDKMIGEAKKRGYKPKNDDEADAIALRDYWVNEGVFDLLMQ